MRARMIPRCPYPNCILIAKPSLVSRPIIRKGSFFRSSDSRRITRYYCKQCCRNFSNASAKLSKFQKKRRITPVLLKLLNSGVSQRRSAMILKVDRKTVVRRFRYLAKLEQAKHERWLTQTYKGRPLSYVQFDDLETSEHTKCKPLSVALAVDPETRKILNFKVNPMPAKGLLSKIALHKYGYRRDERAKGWDQMMKELKPWVCENAIFRSDSNPHYPKFLFRHHPHAHHETSLGGRGAVTGQGELKKLRFDPLFALNHTCAMLRANINRLFRRTWCTTKNRQGLIDHLSIYVTYHNRVLTR
jgi:transposase-like protein